MAAAPAASSRPYPAPPTSPLFTPIPEHEEEAEPKQVSTPYKHHPTPVHRSSTATATATATATKSTASRRSTGGGDGDGWSVACNKCRPSARDKITIVPLDINGPKHQHRRSSSSFSHLSPNPNSILRSLFLSLTRKSPRSSASSSASAAATREEEWKLAATELSRKLLHATRKRDEALLEASRLKYSVSELERKLDRLESHCHDLKASLDIRCATTRPVAGPAGSLPVEPFLRAVSDARSAVRHLSRALTTQIRKGAAGPRVLDRIASLLQPYDVRVAGRNPGDIQSLLFYMEALLNRVFYGEFEAAEEGEALEPAARCEANRAACEAVRGVGWEEVLSKGTRHYSEGLSRFCDRRMSEVVGMLGWSRAWPEGLLQAFFGAAKGAWVVHLLARSVHPPVPILRVERGARFDLGFMEDVAADRVSRLVPASVRMMVAPGFYVYSGGSSSCGVVKCKVLCLYNNYCSNSGNSVSSNSEVHDSNVSNSNSVHPA